MRGRGAIRGLFSLPRPHHVTTVVLYLIVANGAAFLLHFLKDGQMSYDFDDEITRETCVTHDGRVLKGPA